MVRLPCTPLTCWNLVLLPELAGHRVRKLATGPAHSVKTSLYAVQTPLTALFCCFTLLWYIILVWLWSILWFLSVKLNTDAWKLLRSQQHHFWICRLTLLTFHLLFAYSCLSACSFRVLISAWDSFTVSINVWIKRHHAICFKHTPRVKWACHVAIFPLSHILPETFALPAGTPSRSFSDRSHSEEQTPFGSDVLTD